MHLATSAGLFSSLMLLACSGAPSGQPFGTYGDWRLGMTMSEARTAQPRAESRESETCEPGTCLSYFEPEYRSGSRQVSADFGDNDSLNQILATIIFDSGAAACKETGAELRRDYVRAFGEPDDINPSTGFSYWEDENAHLALSIGCDSGVIAIIVSRPLRKPARS